MQDKAKFPNAQFGIIPTIRRIVKQMLPDPGVSFKIKDTHITNAEIADYGTNPILVTDVPAPNQVVRVLYAIIKSTVRVAYGNASTVNLFFWDNLTVATGLQTVIPTNTPWVYVTIITPYSQSWVDTVIAGQWIYFGKGFWVLTGAWDVEMDVKVVYEIIDID